MDQYGVLTIKPAYTAAEPFFDGVAGVEAPGGLWGYIDESGTLVIHPTFAKAGSFHRGKAVVVTNEGNELLIGKSGEILSDGSSGDCEFDRYR